MSGEGKPEHRLRLAAMNALARREHSRAELREKLVRKHPDLDALCAPVLDRLEREGLLSDRRFAEAFARSRVRRGQGPLRILAELRRRGVADDDAEDALAEAGVDWTSLAFDELLKRFGEHPPQEARDKSRRMRFLQQRGFPGEAIREALRRVEGSTVG